MDLEEFEEIVIESVEDLPEEFKERLDNVSVLVQDYPSEYQKRKVNLQPGHMLLGLYEGVPLTKRTSGYGMIPPDKITIFQKPLEAECRYHGLDIRQEITRVVKHEIAHHFGISDARLDEIEKRHE